MSLRVALVHDWITGMRGGERCLEAFIDIYPDADIYTMLHVPGASSEKIDARVKETSFLQKIPGARRFYRLLLPLYPLAIRAFDFKGYDLIVSLSHAAAKNIRTPEDAIHVSYCFTPMRYIWDQAEQYFGKLTFVLFPILLLLRVWDRLCSQGVTQFVAISRFVSARIRCFYGRSAAVIFPPVDTSWIKPTQSGVKGVAFLYAGALVPYKRPDLVVKAFNRLKEELWIVGSGPEEERLRAIAGPNVHFFGRVSDEELADFYGRCRALIFPGKEDFGMIPIECLAAGRPVIALYEGALKETLNGMKPWIPQKRLEEHGESEVESNFVGVFVRNRASDEVRALIDAVSYFVERETQFKVKSCVEAARQFSPERFRESWERLLCRLVPAYQRALFAGREQIGNDVKAETTAV